MSVHVSGKNEEQCVRTCSTCPVIKKKKKHNEENKDVSNYHMEIQNVSHVMLT